MNRSQWNKMKPVNRRKLLNDNGITDSIVSVEVMSHRTWGEIPVDIKAILMNIGR